MKDWIKLLPLVGSALEHKEAKNDAAPGRMSPKGLLQMAFRYLIFYVIAKYAPELLDIIAG